MLSRLSSPATKHQQSVRDASGNQVVMEGACFCLPMMPWEQSAYFESSTAPPMEEINAPITISNCGAKHIPTATQTHRTQRSARQ